MSGIRSITRVLRLGGVYRRLGAGVSLLELCKDGAVEAVLKRCLAAVLREVYDYFAVAARFSGVKGRYLDGYGPGLACLTGHGVGHRLAGRKADIERYLGFLVKNAVNIVSELKFAGSLLRQRICELSGLFADLAGAYDKPRSAPAGRGGTQPRAQAQRKAAG